MNMSAEPTRDVGQLLTEARQGHAECLGSLLELYRNYLHLMARMQVGRQLQGKASASDVVQEVFAQACANFGQFRGSSEAELIAWLRRILINTLARLVAKQLKARKRDSRREVSMDQLMRKLEDWTAAIEVALVSPHSSPSAQAERRELATQVADQLARLPAHYREVIVLRNLEGLSFEEVAKRMERSPGAVRILWLRALDRLREMQPGKE